MKTLIRLPPLLPFILLLNIFLSFAVQAQTPPAGPPGMSPPYGASITLEQARKVLAAADAEARKNGWNMTTAIVDVAGKLVAFQRMDNTAYLSVDSALGKAETALTIRGPSKRMEDNVASGGNQLRWLAIPGIMPLQGGVPIVIDGKTVGAIGTGGGTSPQDEQVSIAGAAAVAK